jgi:selenocysteine lyase/cysteine desulfurase
VRLVVVNHASNVLGVVQDLAPVAERARVAGAMLLVDASQSAGLVPFAMDALGADLVAFSGHKGLYGPMGTGVLLVGPRARLEPIRQGGTGGWKSDDPEQPRDFPVGYEAGTINGVGIAGLAAGVGFVRERGGESRLAEHGRALAARAIEGLLALGRKVKVLSTRPDVGIVSFNLEGWPPAEVATILDESFGIAVGAGLSCTPSAHRLAGTFPDGALRASFGAFNGETDADALVHAVRQVSAARIFDSGTSDARRTGTNGATGSAAPPTAGRRSRSMRRVRGSGRMATR